MEQITVMFSLPEPTLKALRKIAATDGVGIEAILQNAVKRDVARRSHKPKDAVVDIQLVAFLRTILVGDFTRASGWKDLQRRLQNKGYTLHRKGNTLSLCRYPCSAWLCDVTDLGNNFERKTRRFWAPFPDCSNTALPDRMAS